MRQDGVEGGSTGSQERDSFRSKSCGGRREGRVEAMCLVLPELLGKYLEAYAEPRNESFPSPIWEMGSCQLLTLRSLAQFPEEPPAGREAANIWRTFLQEPL